MADSPDPPSTAIDLRQTFLHLGDGGSASLLAVGPDFWTNIDPRLDRGRLVSRFVCDSDWTNWEMHPSGDELIILLSGRMRLILESEDGSTERIELGAGDAALVPKGCWHTADVIEPADAVFVTPGRGTIHRPRQAA